MAPFKSTEWGRMLLSQKIITRKDAAPNRKPDCEAALTEMNRDDFMIHTIATSDPKRADADAVRAGKAFGAKAGQYDYIGKTHIFLAGLQENGSIPPCNLGRFVRVNTPPPDHDAHLE